jgi:hypothetical protein
MGKGFFLLFKELANAGRRGENRLALGILTAISTCCTGLAMV